MASSIMIKGFGNMEVSKDGIATVRMTNGENRFRLSFVNDWNTILDEIERNEAIKALIITGSGNVFSLGLDLEFFKTQTEDYVLQTRVANAILYRRIMYFPVPTVAVLNGHCYGAGAFLALSCDYRVMRSDRGWLCWPEVALGLRFGYHSLLMMRMKIPAGKAQRDAILFGKRLTAQNGYDLGIVDVISTVPNMEKEALGLMKETLGKNGFDRGIIRAMKSDVYNMEEFNIAISKL